MCLKNDAHPHEGKLTGADLHHHCGMQTLFFFANADQSSTNNHSQLLYHAELIQALMWILTFICRPCICHTHPYINSRPYVLLLFWTVYIRRLRIYLLKILFKYSGFVHSRAFDSFWKAKCKYIHHFIIEQQGMICEQRIFLSLKEHRWKFSQRADRCQYPI